MRWKSKLGIESEMQMKFFIHLRFDNPSKLKRMLLPGGMENDKAAMLMVGFRLYGARSITQCDFDK